MMMGCWVRGGGGRRLGKGEILLGEKKGKRSDWNRYEKDVLSNGFLV